MRVLVTIKCKTCGKSHYSSTKNKRVTTDRIELNKYCPACRQHTPHLETK